MYHDLKTSYLDYAKFLKEVYYDVYEELLRNFPLSDIEETTKWDPLWSRFEEALGDLYAEEMFDVSMDKYSDYVANPASDDFSDGDWDTIAIYIEQDIDELLKSLKDTFSEFISSVKFNTLGSEKKINIDKESFYLTFNYTPTLECYYEIDRERILYIHNRSNEDEDLILGHAVDKPDVFKEPEMPEGLTDEQAQEWIDFQSDNYNLSVERGKWEIQNYYFKTLKKTKDILIKNQSVFNNFSSLKEILILGHSVSAVDYPYFKEIVKITDANNVKWKVSYYNEGSIISLKDNLKNVGVPEANIQFVKLENL